MKLGLILWGDSARYELELAKRAETAGFGTLLVVEFFHRNGYVRMAALSQATQTAQIGTGIANAFIRSPLLHASAAMDVDELSGGRVILGLGSATRRMNQDWYGVPFSAPAARMAELVELLRAVFAAQDGGGFRWDGKFWQLNVPIYSRPNAARKTIPIWIAAVNRGMIATAGKVADALVGHPIATRRWHREVTLPGIREAESKARRASGACRLAPYILTSIHANREQAVREAKKQIGFYYTTALYHTVLDLHGMREVGEACQRAFRKFDFDAMADAVPDALVDEIAIACTPDEARDRLAQWKDLTEDPLLYAPSVAIASERVRENLESIVDVFGNP